MVTRPVPQPCWACPAPAQVVSDHHGDVYGLTVHPDRPFLMASASRDSTVRLWSLLDLVPGLLGLALTQPLAQLRAASVMEVFKSPAGAR